MVDIARIATKSGKALSDNSPVILTAIGATGALYTAYLSGKASFKAAEVLREAKMASIPSGVTVDGQESFDNLMTSKDKFLVVWKLYLPAAATAGVTVSAIVAANVVGTRRAAALATAYTLSQRAIDEYREKVIERVGESEEAEIRKELAQERARRSNEDPTEIMLGENEQLMHDAYTGRYFRGSKGLVENAQNQINYKINRSDSATVSDFYDLVGLDDTSVSEEMGWNSENPLELLWVPIATKDGRTAWSYDFAVVPIRNPWQFR